MTVDEFKKLSPESANLEGNELWNAMEDYMLKHGQKCKGKAANKFYNKPPIVYFIEKDIFKDFRNN